MDTQRKGLWLAGYFCYEIGYFLEPHLSPLGINLKSEQPLAWFGIFQNPFILDENQLQQSSEPKKDRISSPENKSWSIENLHLNMTSSEYHQSIKKIKSYLKEGDTYQVNLTLKYKFKFNGDAFEFFRYLQKKQSVAYSGFIHTGKLNILSLSPELFYKRSGTHVYSKPMKGTVQRGKFNSEDSTCAEWLANDPKNKAENTMIIDLVRNDLGRISMPGSVYVTEPYKVEKFTTLYQMTSTVNAILNPDITIEDFFRATFPFGSITGAPKIRTMEIINELEKEIRGVYTGAIGYFAPNGQSQFNVAIRTLVIDERGNGEMGIGGGIVADSTPADEFEECLLKGDFLTKDIETFSLIETMRLKEGDIFLLDLHLNRLKESAIYFDIPCQIDDIRYELLRISTDNSRGTYKLRILLDQAGKLNIEVNKLNESRISDHLQFIISDKKIDSGQFWFYHKTTIRDFYDRERQTALEKGYDEVIFVNERNEITEGTVSNIFLLQSEKLVTPAITSGLLNGTLRQSLINEERCHEKIITKDQIINAQKIFLGNSVMGLIEASIVLEN
jgi:para-aminobenzoate synthetase/4-amino-4-deoxychorismate lyase